MAKVTGKLFTVQPTQSIAHQAMSGLDAYLTSIGLEVVEHANRYDLEGSSGQSPTVGSAVPYASVWRFYKFTDSFQSESPIYIGFRVVKIYQINAPTLTMYAFGWAVCDSISNVGEPEGKYLSSYAGGQNGNSGHNSQFTASMPGDFLRYTGDSLTVSISPGMYYQSSGTLIPRRNGCFFHVERQKDKNGDLKSGFAVVGDTNGNAPTIYEVSVFATTTDDSQASASWAYRAGGLANRMEKLIPIVAPIYYPLTGVDYAVPFRRISTIPLSSAERYSEVNLDFSGQEKPYISYWSDRFYPMSSGYGYLLESE